MKKGFLKPYIIGLFLFGMVISGFWLVPQYQGGFWESYGYAPPPSYNLDEFNTLNSTSQITGTFNNDVQAKNVFSAGKEIVQGIVQGAYSGLVTLKKSTGITELLFTNIGNRIGIPPFIIQTFTWIVVFVVAYTILLIIFNRSDSA